MKFVSRHPQGVVTIIDATEKAEVLQGGQTRYVPDQREFAAQFVVRTLSEAEIKAAQDQFYMGLGPDAFGSVPGRDAGNINIQDAAEEGYASTAHEGFDIYQRLSTFDTEDPTQCPPQYREAAEEILSNHYANGFDWCRVDNYNLSPPWPTYPTGDNPNVEGVVQFAKLGGFVNAAIVYERATRNHPNLIALLEEAQEEERVAQAQEAGLTATV
jgi:hypothetical protein